MVILGSTGWVRKAVAGFSDDLIVLLPRNGQFLYISVVLVIMVNFNEMFEVLFAAFVGFYCAMIWRQTTKEIIVPNANRSTATYA